MFQVVISVKMFLTVEVNKISELVAVQTNK